MKVSEFITIVRQEAKEPVAAFWSESELIGYVDRGQRDFLGKARITEDTASLSLVEGQMRYPLPSNWLSARLVMHKGVDSQSGKIGWAECRPTTLEKMKQLNENFMDISDDALGRPRRYFIDNKDVLVSPAPDAESATTLFLWFKSKAPKVTSVNDEIVIDDSLSEGLVAFVLWKMWKKEEEDDKALEQKAIYDDYVRRGMSWAKKRALNMRNMIDIESNIGIDGFRNPFNPLS